MSFKTGTFEFTLSKSITVSIDGHDQQVDTLTFHECGSGYDDYYYKLRKLINAAQMNFADLLPKIKKLQAIADEQNDDSDNEEKNSLKSGEEIKPFHEETEASYDEKVDASTSLAMMSLGQGDELEKLVKVFGNMVSFDKAKAICTTSCGVKIRRILWHEIHPEDKANMAVKYCAFFGIGLSRPEIKLSDKVSEFPTEVKAL